MKLIEGEVIEAIELNFDNAKVTIHQPTFTKYLSFYRDGSGILEPPKLELPDENDIRGKEYIACRHEDGRVIYNVNLVPIDVTKEISEISVSEVVDVEELDNIALNALRRFLEICRWRTGAYWIDCEIDRPQFSSEYVDKNGRPIPKLHTGVLYLVSNIHIAERSITGDVWNQISSDIISDCEVPLPQSLLLNAQRLLSSKNYRLAIVEAVIALEVGFANFLRPYMGSEGVAEEIINFWYRYAYIPDKMKVVKKVFPENIRKEIDNKKLFAECGRAIEFRNAVVHKGKIISEDEAELIGKYISAIQEMIDYLVGR